MKKAFYILSFLCCQYAVNAQKMPSDYFEEAGRFYENKELDKALTAYQYIVDHYPKNELYPRCFFNVGYLYCSLHNFEKAIAVFSVILNENFNEHESLGGDIMADPYANYRHRASEMLSSIYYEEKKYDSALYYFALSDTAYPYLFDCGNARAADEVHKGLRYANIYQKLKQPDQAIQKLLPAVFITLYDNTGILQELKKLLKGKADLKRKLDDSLKNIYVKRVGGYGDYYDWYYFKFLETEIGIPMHYGVDDKKFDKQKTVDKIRQTDFYAMIKKL